jgi:hypothetical protein
MEILGGAVGISWYLIVSILNPNLYSTWHHLAAVAFYGASLIAGVLLVQQREQGVMLSFIVQLLQIVFWNSGVAWIARAGLHITPVIASTGFGVFAGGAADFYAYPVETTSFGGSGLGYALTFGYFLKPLSEATFACGINLVALWFTMRLWRQVSAEPATSPAVAPRPDHPFARWTLPVTIGCVGVVWLFMLFNGPRSLNSPGRPVARWAVGTGDTLDILWTGYWYEAGVNLGDRSPHATRDFLVRYRSDLHDRARDRTNSAAVAGLVCHYADSLGVKRILVRPTAGGFVHRYMTYSFGVDTAASCNEPADAH